MKLNIIKLLVDIQNKYHYMSNCRYVLLQINALFDILKADIYLGSYNLDNYDKFTLLLMNTYLICQIKV